MKTHIVNAITGENIIRDLTNEEKEKAELEKQNWENNAFNRSILKLRNKRNELLAETDWWGASDNTMTAEQKKYRQDLRDITNGLTTVKKINAVIFPTKPE
tara:strand:+ start:754 stop:1056 length:303 start_codon:yes stop_codon:yes gene_type:complete